MILAKIVEDPQSGTCLNVSYADITGPVANPNPTGSPFANSPGGQSMQNGSLGSMNNPLSAGMWQLLTLSTGFIYLILTTSKGINSGFEVSSSILLLLVITGIGRARRVQLVTNLVLLHT